MFNGFRVWCDFGTHGALKRARWHSTRGPDDRQRTDFVPEGLCIPHSVDLDLNHLNVQIVNL